LRNQFGVVEVTSITFCASWSSKVKESRRRKERGEKTEIQARMRKRNGFLLQKNRLRFIEQD